VRLSRIDALRYGGLENACLSGLGEGLTVVLGPNESGKSTFTALARHVLYGFPDGRKRERSYKPRAGDRAGRLIFADEGGEWAIERVEGKNRGLVTVSALSGPERPGLLGELVGGVSVEAFQAIFGFGLDDLELVGDGDANDIVARLYAAGAGLAVNPMDVRKTLESRAADLYKSGGQKPAVNALASRIRELKLQIRELESEAQRYAGDQARLRELAGRLEPVRARRDELDVATHAIARDLQRLADADEQSLALRGQIAEQDAAIADLTRGAEVIDVDERVIAVEPELAALLEESSGFRQRLGAFAVADNAADEIARRIAAGPDLPPNAHDTAENRATVESWRDRLTRLQAEADTTERAAARSAANATGAESVVSDQTPVAASAGRALPVAFAAIAIVIGVAFLAIGLLVAPPQLLVSALGAAVVVLGVVGLTVALVRRVPAGAQAPLTADAARLRADAQASRVLADGAAADLATARAEWSAWLAVRDLDAHGEDPAAVRQLLDEIRERDGLAAEVARFRADAARERDAAEEWVVRLVDLMRRFDDSAGQIPPLSSALELAARARARLDRARAVQEERAGIARDLAAASAARRGLVERAEAASAAVAEVAEAHGLDSTDPLPQLAALAARVGEERAEAGQAFEELANEHAALRGQLDTEGRDDRMTRARQTLEGLRAQAGHAGDAYVVSALGVHLLDLARERFDRERQPDVVRVAGHVFSEMTLGRYTDVRIPLDAAISVVGAAGDLKPAAELSEGTAEQLYLALRVGLISSLGDLGRHLPVLMDDVAVNYDPERLAAASSAINELAKVRQVVLFTCHTATAEIMTAAVPGASLVTLDRCELRG
jgi:uncharacterized protein YhaN